ncbi:hypothetical protein ABBQ38_000932 [Trebouxia sp. C0009 RCD-2024]
MQMWLARSQGSDLPCTFICQHEGCGSTSFHPLKKEEDSDGPTYHSRNCGQHTPTVYGCISTNFHSTTHHCL